VRRSRDLCGSGPFRQPTPLTTGDRLAHPGRQGEPRFGPEGFDLLDAVDRDRVIRRFVNHNDVRMLLVDETAAVGLQGRTGAESADGCPCQGVEARNAPGLAS
jgi:hypothetical protein